MNMELRETLPVMLTRLLSAVLCTLAITATTVVTASDRPNIVIISSELPEILGMSDRILVMREGRVTGEIKDVEHATQDQIMKLAIQ